MKIKLVDRGKCIMYKGCIYNYKFNNKFYPFYVFELLRHPVERCKFYDVLGNEIKVEVHYGNF